MLAATSKAITDQRSYVIEAFGLSPETYSLSYMSPEDELMAVMLYDEAFAEKEAN